MTKYYLRKWGQNFMLGGHKEGEDTDLFIALFLYLDP